MPWDDELHRYIRDVQRADAAGRRGGRSSQAWLVDVRRALDARDASGLEDTMGAVPDRPDAACIDIAHRALREVWHHSHEDLLRLLQDARDPSSVVPVREAVALKPKLEYLDYDDYGAYYQKCMWALFAIGTDEAHAALRDFAQSEDECVRDRAEERLRALDGEE